MLFRLYLLWVLAAVCHCRVFSQRLVSDIERLTALSTQTKVIAESIFYTNVTDQIPQLIANLQNITELAKGEVSAISGSSVSRPKREECRNLGNKGECVIDISSHQFTPGGDKRSITPTGSLPSRARQWARQAALPFHKEGQQAVCTAFQHFGEIQQQLNSLLIDDKTLLEDVRRLVVHVLDKLKTSLDLLADGIVELTPDCATGITEGKAAVDEILSWALRKYSD